PLPPRAWAGLGALAAMVALYGVIRVAWLGDLGGYRAPDGSSVHAQLAPRKAARFVFRATRAALVPARAAFFPRPLHPVRVVPVVALAVAWGWCLRRGRGRAAARLALPFAAAFVVALLPVASWAGIDRDGQGTRFLYLPDAFACT